MSLLWERDCVACPSTPSSCDPVCGANEVCSLVANSCTQCGGPKCVSTGGGTQKSNSGAIAGGVVAALVAVLIGLGYLWYRRRRMQLAIAAQRRVQIEAKPDVVASAATVLNRPDPLEKPASSKFTITNEDGHSSVFGVDPSSIRLDQMSLKQPENPFSDHASIATASDRATNVIPIGLIDPSSASIALSHGSGPSSGSTPASISTGFTAPSHSSLSPPGTPRAGGPLRPQRAGPELDMRLDLVRPASEASSMSLLPPKAPYAKSSRSGVSGVSSRASTLSTSSSFLNEAPQIVTPKQLNFRQVLGVQRAEVVKLGSTPPSPEGSIKSHLSSSTLGKSPLRQDSGDADQSSPSSIASGNPFSDRSFTSPSPSSPGGDWSSSRPTSTMSAVESIANISTVQRIQVVRPLAPRVAEARQLLAPPSPASASYTQTQISSPHSSPASTPRATDFRSAGQLSPRANGEFRTSGPLSPPAQAIPRSFDDGMDNHRMSGSSLALTNRTSTTDSILEAFPFVPPSPISLAANGSGGTTPRTPRTFQQQQEAALQYQQQGREDDFSGSEAPTPRPGRMTLGMSTMSAASSGLGSYAFQIEGAPPPPPPPGLERRHGEERASLDTIQLSRDLAQFPLPGDSPTNLKNL